MNMRLLFLLMSAHLAAFASGVEEKVYVSDSMKIVENKNSIRSQWKQAPADSSHALIDNLEAVATRAKDTLAQGFVLLYRAKLAQMGGDTTNAIRLFKESSGWYASGGRAEFGSGLLENIGDIYRGQNEVDSAVLKYRQAIQMSLASVNPKKERSMNGAVLKKLERIHRENNRTAEYEAFMDSALNHKNVGIRYQFLMDQATIAWENGNIAQATKVSFDALEIAEQLKSPALTWRAYATLGYVLPDPLTRDKYNKLAGAIMDTMEGPFVMMMHANNMAMNAFEAGWWQASLENARKQVLINDTSGFQRSWHYVRPYNMIAMSYKEMGFLERALEVSDTALEYSQRSGSQIFLMSTYAFRSEIQLALGNTSLAYKSIKSADEHYSKSNFASIYNIELAEFFETYNKVAERVGKYKEAYKAYHMFIEIRDSMNNEKNTKVMVQRDMEYQYHQQAVQDSLAEAETVRLEQVALAAEISELDYRNRIQISGVVLFVLFLLSLIVMSGHLNIGPNTAEGLIFIFFILLFEFILVVMDPWVDKWSDGEVIVKLAINSSFALLIYFGHHFFAGRLKGRILQNSEQ
jgi:tetratricopeptide (TPR) repeat protein